MVIVVITSMFAYLIDAIWVGVFLAFCRLHGNWHFPKWVELVILAGIFMFLSFYWLPVVTTLDAKIVIGNSRLAEALMMPGEFPLMELFSIGWFEILGWGAQVIVAVWIADQLCRRAKKQAI